MTTSFSIFIAFSVVLLQLLASRYVSMNDLAVYSEAISDNRVYEGDLAFELLQSCIANVFGAETVIYGIQLTLLLLVVAYIYKISAKISANMYTVAFLVFSSPVLLVGLTNSIRQSLSFFLVMLAFEMRNIFLRLGLIVVAILMHKVAIVLVAVLTVIFFEKSLRDSYLESEKTKTVFVVLLSAFLLLAWHFDGLKQLIGAIFDRYSVYLDSAPVFTEGRVGALKLVAWILFWLLAFFVSRLCNSGQSVLIFIVVPLLYTLLITADAIMRGFDEFHSRMLMLNNVFVLVWMVEALKENECKNKIYIYWIVFVFNIFNPSTIGVLI